MKGKIEKHKKVKTLCRKSWKVYSEGKHCHPFRSRNGEIFALKMQGRGELWDLLDTEGKSHWAAG